MSQETNHTQKPWLAISANGGGVTIRTNGNKWVKASPSDVAAMKAAPDLIEVMREARHWIWCCVGECGSDDMIARIDAALAKAEVKP